MPSPRSHRWMIAIHRWLTLVFTPVLMPILFAAAMMAVLPLAGPAPLPWTPVEWSDALDALHVADPKGDATALRVGADGKTLTVIRPAGERTLALATREPAVEATTTLGNEVSWKWLHTQPFGLPDGVVKLASIALTFLAVSGLLLARPKMGRSVRSVHILGGWLLLPLVLLTPVTGVMLGFHIGVDGPPHYDRTAGPMHLDTALEMARGANVDVSSLKSIQILHGIEAVVTVGEGRTTADFIVTGDGTVVRHGNDELVRALHEGSWAEPWSRAVSLLSVVALAGLNLTGLWIWGRRRVVRVLKARPVVA